MESDLHIFDEIYANGGWDQLGSGPGSSPEEYKPYIDFVCSVAERLYEKGKPGILTDWGCGDGRVIKSIARQIPHVVVFAYDCVGSEISRLLGDSDGIFYGLRDFRSPASLPEESSRLILCKDVLHHWPNEMVDKFLQEFSELKSLNWLLMTMDSTNSTKKTQRECKLGGYAPIHFVQFGWWEAKRKYQITEAFKYNHKTVWAMPSGGMREAIHSKEIMEECRNINKAA